MAILMEATEPPGTRSATNPNRATRVTNFQIYVARLFERRSCTFVQHVPLVEITRIALISFPLVFGLYDFILQSQRSLPRLQLQQYDGLTSVIYHVHIVNLMQVAQEAVYISEFGRRPVTSPKRRTPLCS